MIDGSRFVLAKLKVEKKLNRQKLLKPIKCNHEETPIMNIRGKVVHGTYQAQLFGKL